MSVKFENKDNARRKLLKGLAVGSGIVIAGKNLPDSWSKPVVDAVLLPVHAQTSTRSFSGASNQASIDNGSQFAGVIDSLIQQSHAIVLTFTAESCIQLNDDGTVIVDAVIDDGYSEFAQLSAASVEVGGPRIKMEPAPCEKILSSRLLEKTGLIPTAKAETKYWWDNVEVEISSIDGKAVGRFLFDGVKNTLSIDLPPGDCSAPQCPDIHH